MPIHRGICYCLERVTFGVWSTYRMKYCYHYVLLGVSLSPKNSPKNAKWALYTITVKKMQVILKLRRRYGELSGVRAGLTTRLTRIQLRVL